MGILHNTCDDQSYASIHALGIDGGGSKTRVVVVDAQGNERGRGLAGSANYQALGVERAVEHMRTAIEEAVQMAGCSLPLKVAWLGLAGIDRPADREALLPHLRFIAESIRVTNDAELVLGALEERAGVALIAGTGSIALGQDGCGRVERVGGWGHILGDEGSGYDIGRRSLQAAARSGWTSCKQKLLVPLPPTCSSGQNRGSCFHHPCLDDCNCSSTPSASIRLRA